MAPVVFGQGLIHSQRIGQLPTRLVHHQDVQAATARTAVAHVSQVYWDRVQGVEVAKQSLKCLALDILAS